MGAEQPFLYDPPSTYTYPYKAFNPKAVSQASFQQSPPKPARNGPLVEFNKHPDSYLILPYGNTNAKPMSPSTRKKVKYTRWAQLILRCLTLLGAIGLMICVICVRHVEETVGWVLRITPGISILHSVYGIYHLSRSPTCRTPGSSAGYMLFAAAADTCLLPFHAFIALVSRAQYVKEADMEWKSVFDGPDATYKIAQAVFLSSIINGGLHVISLLVSLYLAIIFRKITKLPPDMNPLEDNLTSRHKKSKSNMTEKRISQSTTASSFNGPMDLQRNSQAEDPLIQPPRTVPFMHTRTGSADSFKTARQAPSSKRNSRVDLPSQVLSVESQRGSRTNLARSVAASSASSRSSYYADVVPGAPGAPESRESLHNDNWFTYYDENEADVVLELSQEPARSESVVSSIKDYEMRFATDRGYQRLRQQPFSEVPNPLEAHPPTPPPGGVRKGLLPGTPNRIGSIKAKLYGELKPATPPVMVTKGGPALARNGGGRVVSNSGADITDGRREVSGKVAEEGRGGVWTRLRKVSGR